MFLIRKPTTTVGVVFMLPEVINFHIRQLLQFDQLTYKTTNIVRQLPYKATALVQQLPYKATALV